MAERIRIPRGQFGNKDELFYTKDEIDNLLFSRNRLNARVFGNASLFGGSNLFEDFFIGDGSSQGFGAVIGVTAETLSGTYTDFDAELYVGVEQGIDYLIFNANTVDIFVFTPTAPAEVGLVNIAIEQQVIDAPAGSYIYAQNTQQAAENRRYTERIVDLQTNIDTLNNTDLPALQDNIDILDGYLQDPSTIPDNYTFFEGIVSNEVWAGTGVFMTAWADQVFANSIMTDRVTANIIDTDDLAANTGFIEVLFANEIALTLNTDTGKGGLIRSTAFDGGISASNLITGSGSQGWAIDYGGNSVFHNTYVRGTIIVEGGDAAKQVFATSESIKGLKQELISRKQVIDQGYNTVYNNANLTGSAKTNLASAKSTLDAEYTDLVDYIDTATADDEVTSAEYSTFNSHYSDYQSALSTYSQRFQQAVESYTTAYTDSNLDNAAQQLGYVDYDAWVAAAAANDTIISGGFIRTSLVQADDLLSQNIIVDGGYLRSSNYSAGSAGFSINGSTGDAEFNDVFVRGEINVNVESSLDDLIKVGSSVWIGDGVDSKEGPEKLVLGRSSSGFPYWRVQGADNLGGGNYVQAVGVSSPSSNPFFSIFAGGDEVLSVTSSGLVMGDKFEITNSAGDFTLDETGLLLQGSGGKLSDIERRVEWDIAGTDMFVVGIGPTNPYIYIGGTGDGLQVRNTGEVYVEDDLTVENALVKGSGSFRINHPNPTLNKTHQLWHSFVESPTAGDNIYRYEIEATQNNDVVTINLPDYYKFLNKDSQAWVIGKTIPAIGYNYQFNENVFEVTCPKKGRYDVLIIGTRKDEVATKNWKGEVRPNG